MSQRPLTPYPSAIGEELANVTEAGNQNNSVVAVQTDGSFIIVWESDGQDGSEATVILLMAVWHSWTGDGSGTRSVGQRLWGAVLFRDGFESGEASGWSLVAGW